MKSGFFRLRNMATVIVLGLLFWALAPKPLCIERGCPDGNEAWYFSSLGLSVMGLFTAGLCIYFLIKQNKQPDHNKA